MNLFKFQTLILIFAIFYSIAFVKNIYGFLGFINSIYERYYLDFIRLKKFGDYKLSW